MSLNTQVHLARKANEETHIQCILVGNCHKKERRKGKEMCGKRLSEGRASAPWHDEESGEEARERQWLRAFSLGGKETKG